MATNYFLDESMPSLQSFAPTTVEATTKQPGRISDTVDAVQAGGLSALGGIFDFIGAEGIAQSLYATSDEQYTQMSDRGREALSKQFVTEDEQGNFQLSDGATDLDTWLLTMANVAGQFAGTAVPGAGWASGTAKIANLGATGKKIVNAASMGFTGGAAATGQGMEQARQEIFAMPDQVKAASPLFQEILRGVHQAKPDATNTEKWEAAEKALANQVAKEVRSDPSVLIANFAASAIGDPIIGKALTGARISKNGALRSALAGFVTEGSTEAVQAGTQQYGINKVLANIDNRDTMQGVTAAALNEGLAGGGFGGVAGGFGGLVNKQQPQTAKQPNATAEPGATETPPTTEPPGAEQAPLATDPATEQVKQSNSVLDDALEKTDQHSTKVKSDLENLEIPAVARQSGITTEAEASKFAELFTRPSQESLKNMRSQSVLDMINDAVNNLGPTPDDRFSPIKYQHVGELLSPEQSREASPFARQTPRLENGAIDGEAIEKHPIGITQTRGITDKNIIFGQDNRPAQRAQAQVAQAKRDSQNLLAHKNIIFANDHTGVNVKRSGLAFQSEKEARNSKEARKAKRNGFDIRVVPFDNGFGWVIDNPPVEAEPQLNPKATAELAGDPINDEWTAFSDQSGTKHIPRSEMPQIKAENRGAMVNFMNARGIKHQQEDVSASSLKPTQQEFSPAKVKKAMEYQGGNRSILVSSDDHVLDGHHQWLAAREKGEQVTVIRLDAPIEQLISLAKEMPSTEVHDTETGNVATNQVKSEQNQVKSEQNQVKSETAGADNTSDYPLILRVTKRKWMQEKAKEQGLKKGSPGYAAAMAQIDEAYEHELDKALTEQPFEVYQQFNDDTPESINKQAYAELRKEFNLDVRSQEQSAEKQQPDTQSKNEPVPDQGQASQPTESNTPIDDFGEKLGGARKDQWGGFAESLESDAEVVKSAPLSRSLPHPDYVKMAGEGVDPNILAFIAIARESIPNKPRAAYKLSGWVDYVSKVKEAINRVLKEDADPKAELNLLNHFSRRSKLDGAKEALESIANADPEVLKEAAKYRIKAGSYSLFRGQRYSPSKTFYTIEKIGFRVNLDDAFESLSEAQAALTKVIKKTSAADTKGRQVKINIFRDRYTSQVYLGWKGASGVLKIQEFDSPGAARAYLAENRAEVEAKLEKMKSTPSMRKPVNAARVGPVRIAENVTAESFTDAFGFRGVEFGNWVEQGKRQKDLNQAYDALMDLAEAIDIPPKALSLNGKLGLAFGARGVGGKDAAAAHYEPGHVVINLTKKAGAGSLAHEWWHALDNYFGKMKGHGTGYVTDSPYTLPGENLRSEMAEAFKLVRNAITASGLPKRSLELDKRKSKKYWSTVIEMTARSFETFIIDKLKTVDIQNDFLANVVSDEAWQAAEALGFESDSSFPYPLSAERDRINAAYQMLFDTIEHKETSAGIQLFSKTKTNTQAKGVSKASAERVAEQFINSLKGANGINVHVLESTVDAEKLWRMNLEGATVKGGYSDKTKTVYVIAENIENEADLKQTLAHETIAHGGLDTVIGADAKKAFIDRIKATKGRKAFEKYWKDANADYWDYNDDVKAEEIFARFVESEPSKGELKYWWQAFKRWLKAQLDKVGVMYREDDEITAMRDMLESIVKGFKAQNQAAGQALGELAYSQSGKKLSTNVSQDEKLSKKPFVSIYQQQIQDAIYSETDSIVDDNGEVDYSEYLDLTMNLDDSIEEQVANGDVKNLRPDLFELWGWTPSSVIPLNAADSQKAITILNAKVLYHGSPVDDIESFDVSEDGAFYLTHHMDEAEEYAGDDGRIYEVMTNIKNPLFVLSSESTQDMAGDEFFGEARRRGYDAIVPMDNGEVVILDESALQGELKFNREVDKSAADLYREDLAKSMRSLRSRVPPIKVGKTPDVMVRFGAPELDLYIRKDTIVKATNGVKENHDVPMSVIEQLPELLADPIAVLDDSGKMSAQVLIVNATTEAGKPVAVAIHLDVSEGRAQINKIASAYGKDNFKRMELRYLNENKNPALVRLVRPQLPLSGSPSQGLDANVLTKADLVNENPDIRFSKTANEDTRTAKEKLGLEAQAKETLSDKTKQRTNETIETLKSSSFWQRLNEGIFDGLIGIKHAEEAVGVTDPNKQGYVSARLAAGISDILHGVFNYGAPKWVGGIIQRKENTKGLLEVFAMLDDDLNSWLAWMGAHRAEKLKAEGRENNLTSQDIAELKALANGKEALFEKVRTEYNKINSAIIDVAQEAGLLSQEQRDSFDEEYYVPFFRDMGETDPEMDAIKRSILEPHSRRGIAGQSAQIKELKGGTQSTKDLLENIITRQSTLIEASVKNKAMQEVVDNLSGTDYMQAETSEDIAALSQEELNKLHRVRVMKNGKASAYLVSDPSLLRALIQINDLGSQSLFNKMGRSAKRFLTAGITLSPDFIFKNFMRDAAHAWMINKGSFKFGTDSIKGLKKAFKEDEAYRDLIFSGAAFQGGYIHGADPEAAAQQLRRALRSKGLTDSEADSYLDSVINSGSELIEKYRSISDKVENANRLSTYESALDSGKSKRQAAYEAKDLMDYSLKGNFKLIGTMIDMLPFFNARLQGMSKLVRAAKAGDQDRVLKVLSANLAMKGIKVAGLSLALAALNDDDERYQELAEWDKDANWHFFVGDDHWRIPKPFELGIIFGTLPERLFNLGTGNQSTRDFSRSMSHAVFSTMSLNPIPQFALPVTEALINKSFFRDSSIEGMADERKQAADRYGPNTSDTVVALAQSLGVSPKKVEHIIKGYTGTIGSYILGASDIVARQMMGIEKAETPINRYPVIKAVYQGDGPQSNTKFANDFYEALDAANQAYGSYKYALEMGDTNRQQALLENNSDQLGARVALSRVQRQVSKINKEVKIVNSSKQLSAAQKRERLDQLQRQKNALYHQAFVTLKLNVW